MHVKINKCHSYLIFKQSTIFNYVEMFQFSLCLNLCLFSMWLKIGLLTFLVNKSFKQDLFKMFSLCFKQ